MTDGTNDKLGGDSALGGVSAKLRKHRLCLTTDDEIWGRTARRKAERPQIFYGRRDDDDERDDELGGETACGADSPPSYDDEKLRDGRRIFAIGDFRKFGGDSALGGVSAKFLKITEGCLINRQIKK